MFPVYWSFGLFCSEGESKKRSGKDSVSYYAENRVAKIEYKKRPPCGGLFFAQFEPITLKSHDRYYHACQRCEQHDPLSKFFYIYQIERLLSLIRSNLRTSKVA